MDRNIDITEYEFTREKVLSLAKAFQQCLFSSDISNIGQLIKILRILIPQELVDNIEGLPPVLETGEKIYFGENIPAYILVANHGYQLHFDAPTDQVEATQQFINYLTDNPNMLVRGFSAKVILSALQRLYKHLVTVSFHTTFVPFFNRPDSNDPLISIGMIDSVIVDPDTANIYLKILDEDSTVIQTIITPKDLISELLRAIYPASLHNPDDYNSIAKAFSRLSMTFQRVKAKEA